MLLANSHQHNILRNIVLFTIGILICNELSAGTLYESWLSTKKNNLEIKTAIKELEIAGIHLTDGMSEFLPNVVLDSSYQRYRITSPEASNSETTSVVKRISIEQKIVDMNSIQNITSLKIQKEIDGAVILQKIEDVRYRFLKAYLETAKSEQLLSLFETAYNSDLKTIENTLASGEFTELKGTAGIGFELVRLESLKSRMLNLRAELERNRSTLFEITNIDKGNINIDFMRVKLLDNSSTDTNRRDVSYQLLTLKKMKLNSLSDAEKNSIFPTLSLFASRTWNDNYRNVALDDRSDNDMLVGIRVMWSLTLGIRGQSRSEIEKIREGLASVETKRFVDQRSQRIKALQNVLKPMEQNAGGSLNLYKKGDKLITIARDKREAGIISQTDQLSLIISALELKSSAIDTMANFLLLQIDQRYESNTLDEDTILSISKNFAL